MTSQRRRSVPKSDPVAVTLVKMGAAAEVDENGDGGGGGGGGGGDNANKDETISMRTFSQSSRQRPRQQQSLAEKRLRRRSSVVHEEADFAVKVHCWQRKINDETGTEHEVNLNKARRTRKEEGREGGGDDDAGARGLAGPNEIIILPDGSLRNGLPLDDDVLVLRRRKRTKRGMVVGPEGKEEEEEEDSRPLSCCLPGVILRKIERAMRVGVGGETSLDALLLLDPPSTPPRSKSVPLLFYLTTDQ